MSINTKSLVFGLFIGAILTIGIIILKDFLKKFIIYESKQQITFNDSIIIPKGTKLLLKKSMPEGYDIIQLELRVFRGNDLFRKYVSHGSHDAFYWYKGDKDTSNNPVNEN